MVKEEKKSWLENGKLPNKQVVVKPNFENPGWIKNPKHRAFFMVDGAYRSFVAPLDKSGTIYNVLTDEEKSLLEEILQIEKNGLSVYKKTDNYWSTFTVRVTKEGLPLDLSNPIDYMKFKVLLANKDDVAPSIKDKKKKATYKFFIEDKEELNQVKSEESNLNAQVWSTYGRIANDKKKMMEVLYVYAESFGNKYKRLRNVSEENELSFLQTELSKVVEEDKGLFLEVVNDPLFDVKLLLSKAIKKGLINRMGEEYKIKGDPNSFAKNFLQACKYLQDDVNQDFVLTLTERIKADD